MRIQTRRLHHTIPLTKSSNTAQILTSLYEADDQASESQIEQPLQLLEEALQLLSQCLAKQEEQAQASQAQANLPVEEDSAMDADDDKEGVSLSDESSAPQEERWASIVEPVTTDTLLDTRLIQLETLATFVKALPRGHTDALDFAAKYAGDAMDARSVGTHFLLGESVIAHSPVLCSHLDGAFMITC